MKAPVREDRQKVGEGKRPNECSNKEERNDKCFPSHFFFLRNISAAKTTLKGYSNMHGDSTLVAFSNKEEWLTFNSP